MKEQDKTLEKVYKMDISNLPDKEFKDMVIKMLNDLRIIDKYSENFHKEKIKN